MPTREAQNLINASKATSERYEAMKRIFKDQRPVVLLTADGRLVFERDDLETDMFELLENQSRAVAELERGE